MNPYAIIAALVFAIGLFGAGVSIGYKWSERAHAADLVAVQNEAIAGANRATEVEVKRAVAAAKTEAAARLAARAAKHQGELDALKKSRAACARDAESMGLLTGAIDQVNGGPPAASVVRVPMRPDAGPAGWLGAVPAKLGISGNRNLRPVP